MSIISENLITRQLRDSISSNEEPNLTEPASKKIKIEPAQSTTGRKRKHQSSQLSDDTESKFESLTKLVMAMQLDQSAVIAYLGIGQLSPNDKKGTLRLTKVIEAALRQANCLTQYELKKLEDFRVALADDTIMTLTRHDLMLKFKLMLPHWTQKAFDILLDLDEEDEFENQMFKDSLIE